jgi:RNA polymerase sigma-70 factor (ECF subfamily)
VAEPGSALNRLIRDARRARRGAREQLLEAYRNYLELLARTGIDAALRGMADPFDLVQETLVKAYRRFSQFRGRTEGELVAWLRQILANNLADLGRRYRRARARRVGREQSLEQALRASSSALDRLLAAEGPSPSESAEQRELAVVLADALAELSAAHREVLVLRSLQERRWVDVAKRLRRSVGAVRMLWARALKQLRPLIEKRL